MDEIMARKFIEDWEQLAPIAQYDAKKMAELCKLSVRQLQRDFRRQFARTPQDWLNEQRLKAAQDLLLSGKSIKLVAFELGFKQASHFCRQFKAYHNLTPSEFIFQTQILEHVVDR
jgi:transcriptional regulator GlxA family with amidase domain